MIDYALLYKDELPVDAPWPQENEWDIFVSAYTAAERVRRIYDAAAAGSKHWLVFPEYGFDDDQVPAGSFCCQARDEAEYVQRFWDASIGDLTGKRLCVDITGFIRPYLVFLVKWLFERGVQRFDALYSEPLVYSKREETRFSDEAVVEVRQIAGFEGTHAADTSNDYLIIGAGYDHQLIAQVAESKEFSKKIQIFGLPSLRADMYQENVLRAFLAEEAVGRNTADPASSYFAPANDPFATASTLREIVSRINSRRPITNLYLSPLATKPQVLGFAVYYLTERRNSATSVIFPFCESYEQETTTGVSRVWKYSVEFPIPLV
jgi:hypothetical protein